MKVDYLGDELPDGYEPWRCDVCGPGGNITGITNFEDAMGGKWLELLKEVAPYVSTVTVLSYPGMIGGVVSFPLRTSHGRGA